MHNSGQWLSDVIGPNHTLKTLICYMLCQAEPRQWEVMGYTGNVVSTCCSHMVLFWTFIYTTSINKGTSNRSNKIADTDVVILDLYRCKEEWNWFIIYFHIICSTYSIYVIRMWIMSVWVDIYASVYIPWYIKFKEIRNTVLEII